MPPDPSAFKALGRYAAIGIEFSVSILAGLFLGYWVDQRTGTYPWLSLLGLIVGSIAAFRVLVRVAHQLSEDDSGD